MEIPTLHPWDLTPTAAAALQTKLAAAVGVRSHGCSVGISMTLPGDGYGFHHRAPAGRG